MDLISNLYNISFYFTYTISISGILQRIVTKQEMYHIRKTEEHYKAGLTM